MEDINNIKKLWKEMDARVSNLENENRKLMQTIKKSDYRSAQEKLVHKYAGFIFVECIMIVFMSLFFIYSPELNEKYRIAALVYWDIFFLVEVIVDSYLMMRIKKINIYEATLNEITKRAALNWKFHKIAMIVGLPLAIGAIILFCLTLHVNAFIIYGMVVGGTVGLIIGINQLLKFKNYYKLLKTTS